MTGPARSEGAEVQRRARSAGHSAEETPAHDDTPVQMDAAYYDEVRRAVGRGTPTLLLGTSTRSIDRNLGKLKAVQQRTSRSGMRSGITVDTLLRAEATDTIERLLQEHPGVANEIREILRSRIYMQELTRRTETAKELAASTELRDSNLAVRLDPAGHRILSFGVGLAAVVALVALNVFPLNWAAQAFGLNSAGTWLATFILVAASVGAMLGLVITRSHLSRRRLLVAVVTVGYLALLAARIEFLTIMAGDSFLVALLQAALLAVISAGLVLCGSAVVARTRFPSQSRAHASARRAARAAEEARAAQALAVEKVQRQIENFHQVLLPWALSSAPEDADYAEWDFALEQAVHSIFK